MLAVGVCFEDGPIRVLVVVLLVFAIMMVIEF